MKKLLLMGILGIAAQLGLGHVASADDPQSPLVKCDGTTSCGAMLDEIEVIGHNSNGNMNQVLAEAAASGVSSADNLTVGKDGIVKGDITIAPSKSNNNTSITHSFNGPLQTEFVIVDGEVINSYKQTPKGIQK